jgi:tetratricopeptide (TPR) repeat protein
MHNKGWYLTGVLLILTLFSVSACSKQDAAQQSLLEIGAEKLKAKDDKGAAEAFKQYIDSQSSLVQASRKVIAKYHGEDALAKAYTLVKPYESRAKNLPSVDRGEFYRMIGLLAMQSEDTMAEAPAHYEKGLQADPSNHGLLNDYAYSLAENNHELDKAEKLVKKAIALRSNEGNYYDTIGWIYYKQGKYSAALTPLKYAAATTSGLAEVRYHLAEVYLKLNRISDAKVELEKAIAMDPKFEPAKKLKEKLGQ